MEHHSYRIEARLEDLPDGRIRLVFDDGRSDGRRTLYTQPDLDRDRFVNTDWSETTLEDVGLALLLRLAVMNGHARDE